jgi:hypothetical protein
MRTARIAIAGAIAAVSLLALAPGLASGAGPDAAARVRAGCTPAYPEPTDDTVVFGTPNVHGIVGIVQDSTDQSYVDGAQVWLTDGKGVGHSTQTNCGFFAFLSTPGEFIAPGEMTVEVDANGFQSQTQQQEAEFDGQSTIFNFSLKPQGGIIILTMPPIVISASPSTTAPAPATSGPAPAPEVTDAGWFTPVKPYLPEVAGGAGALLVVVPTLLVLRAKRRQRLTPPDSPPPAPPGPSHPAPAVPEQVSVMTNAGGPMQPVVRAGAPDFQFSVQPSMQPGVPHVTEGPQ